MVINLLASTWSFSTTMAYSAAAPLITAESIKAFFLNMLNNPLENMMPIMICSAIVIATVCGLLYLIKMVYERCQKKAEVKTR